MMKSLAIVIEEPQRVSLTELAIDEPAIDEVVVESRWSGVSAGTEKLLFTGRMPDFPGMGYPLVPGYETVGTVVRAGAEAQVAVGSEVFVPGAKCFGSVRGLHGGSASRLVVASSRVVPISETLGERGVLLALAATALHAVDIADPRAPTLVVGHGALGRLIARIIIALNGEAPVVWETNPNRALGAMGYSVISPEEDPRRDYRSIIDVSGDTAALDHMVQRLGAGGRITLAGFYDRVNFAFPPAFMRETELRIAAQWSPGDLAEVVNMVASGGLSLDGLITHRRFVREAREAYPIAFSDPTCVKMVLDWSAT